MQVEDDPSRDMLLQFLRTGGKASPELTTISKKKGIIQQPDDTLYLACERHQLDISLINGILLQRPDALSIPRERGWLPLHHAAMANSYDAVEFLLEKYPEGAFVQQDDGFMPLHMAVYFEDVDVDIVSMVLEANPAAAEHLSRDGRTALHIALQNPNMDHRLIRLLLDAHPGAARMSTDQGKLPLHLCLENKHCTMDIFMAVLEAYPKAVTQRDAAPRLRLPLHYAVIGATGSDDCGETFIEIVKVLTERHPKNTEMGDYNGKNPLHLVLQALATCQTRLPMIKAGFSRADTPSSDEDSEGRPSTPNGDTDHSTETHSVGSGFSDLSVGSVAEALLDIFLAAFPGALREKCSSGRTPLTDYLDRAARPSLEAVEALAAANPQALMVGDHRGWTPMHVLLSKPVFHLDIFESMLKHCPEVSTVACLAEASLPIHVALRNTHAEVQDLSFQVAKRLLLTYPGAADQADSKGFLPIHLLVSRSNPDTSLLRRLLDICPLGVETPTCEDSGALLPIHCAVVAARPSKPVIELVLNSYPEGLQCRCSSNLCPLDYLFLNMKSQYCKKNMLRSATPSLRLPSRADAVFPDRGDGTNSPTADTSDRVSSPSIMVESSGLVSTDLFREIGLFEFLDPQAARRAGVDDGDSITGRNNNVMNYFKGKTDEEILYFTLDLLKNNDFEVTDDIIVMFGSRLSETNEITEDTMMFRGTFGDHNADACQCVIM